MNGVLADVNIEGHVDTLIRIVEQPPYDEFWLELDLRSFRFPDVGLSQDADDVAVWHVCQQRRLVLITANRNRESETSLESAIRAFNPYLTRFSVLFQPQLRGNTRLTSSL